MNVKRIDCKKCKNYYITWDMQFPYGCKLFSIKSKQMPNIVIYQSLGKHCEAYEDKIKRKDY